MDARSDGARTDARMSDGTGERIRHALGEIDSIARSFDLAGHLERHPIATIAAAAGVGFVVGGGLFRPLAGRMIRTGLRLAVFPLAEQMLSRLLTPASEQGAGQGGPVNEAGAAP